MPVPRHLAREEAHDGQRRHVQRHAGARDELGLVHLVAAAHHVAWPAAGLDDVWGGGSPGGGGRRGRWLVGGGDNTTRGGPAACLGTQGPPPTRPRSARRSRGCGVPGRRPDLQRSSSSCLRTSPMIWPTLCRAFRSSSVLSYSFFCTLTDSRRLRTLVSISLCLISFFLYSATAWSRRSAAPTSAIARG
jgi:hypothetical protein